MFLPRNKALRREKAAEFEAKFGMPKAFGCIDGTNVRSEDQFVIHREISTKKKIFTMSMQAVCGFQGHFMDIDCRWSGSIHDAKVFANSSLSKKLNNKSSSFHIQATTTKS